MPIPDPRDFGSVSRREFLRASASGILGASLFDPRPRHGFVPREWPDDAYPEVIAALRRSIPRLMERRDIPGLSIALGEGGRVLWSEGFGHTDRSRAVPVTADTPFFVGSISKSFTALGVLRAASRGALSLDEPLAAYLPWFALRSRSGASAARGITLRHLLSHHAGLGTWAPLGNPYEPDYLRRSWEEVVRSTAGSWLKSEPGYRFEYSNQGIDLAGFALQSATGRPFEAFMEAEVLRPLGMTSSTFAGGTDSTSPQPYEGARPVPLHQGAIHPMRAAGGLRASANDLARFVAFHLGGAPAGGGVFVDAARLREMYAPQFSAREQPSGYGLGVYGAIEHGTPRYSHGGLGFGVSTHYRWLPEHGIGVVVLTNQGSAHNAPALAGEAVQLMLRAKLGMLPRNGIPAPTASPPATGPALETFAGSYLLYDGIVARFEAVRGRLVQRFGRDSQPLERTGAAEFAQGSRRFVFSMDDHGAPRSLRIEDPYYDPSSAENSVLHHAFNDGAARAGEGAAEEWRRYVGTYRGSFIGAEAHVVVSLRAGHLYLDDTLLLSPGAPDLFFLADGESVAFSPDRVVVGNRPFVRSGSSG